MRVAGYALLALLVLSLAPLAGHAGELRIAAWNLEHLDDIDGEGCVGRTPADYATLARRIEELEVDVVAFQEVENAAAANRVFPASGWHVEMSRRPPMKRNRACWGKRGSRLGHLATGFAIRRGIAYRRNADLEALGAGNAFQRWGTDVTVTAGSRELRLLSVHLRTGCWGAKQDGEDREQESLCDAPRSDRAAQRLGRRPAGGGEGLRHPGGFQPSPDAPRRLGMARSVAALGAVTSADRRRAVPLRSPVPGVHRPHGGGRRRGGDAGTRLVPRGPAARAASRPLRDIGGVPARELRR